MSIAVVFIALVIGTDESLTSDEIIAVFRQNALRATTLRVTSESVTRRSTVAMAADRIHARNIRRNVAGHAVVPEDEKPEALKRADELEAASNDERLQFSVVDYWTDRQNVQVRRQAVDGGPPPWNKIHASLKFPLVELSRESLTREFATTLVISHGPATNDEYRRWDGSKLSDGYWSAGVFNSWRTAQLSDIQAPPLFLPTSQSQLATHPYDLLFQPGINLDTQIVEQQNLGGVSTILVAQHRPKEVPSIVPGGAPGDVVVRAWVDPARGCLPLRIERVFGGFDSATFKKNFAVPSIDPQLLQTAVTKVSIVEAADGVFIPVEMEIEGYIIGPMENPPPNMRPDQFDPPTIVGTVTKTTLRTEINRPMTVEMFALPFPEGTVFLNHSTNDIMVTGDREGFAERVITGALKRRAATPRSWPYWLGGVLAVGCVGFVYRWLRRRRA